MPNRLINEHSLYLRQHAHNPVDWYPWGEAAFVRAREENKPVLVSIGYAACHWCHVMERESFEDQKTADFMNAHFICIKVDREERPDVDSIYMDAVQAIAGSGGWPLNVFVTPDKIPFYGGTYFPPRPAYGRASWLEVLARIQQLWTEEKDAVHAQAGQMRDYLAQAVAVPGGQAEWGAATLQTMTRVLLNMADQTQGGFGRAPKFPGSMALDFLLLRFRYAQDEAAFRHALLSLDKMAAGGIYDQLAGGFARYSTDNEWLAPHFEKMLYDNALLIATYARAYRLTGSETYNDLIAASIAFASRELRGPDSGEGFYSALDADSEGVEGKFYTFTWQEWQAATTDGAPLAAAYFGVTEKGNWEGTNILHIAKAPEEISGEYNLALPEVLTQIKAAKEQLLRLRQHRIRPATDDKVLLNWNALMNLALTDAGIALQQQDYLEQAKRHMDWLLSNFQDSGKLYHVWRRGTPRIPANLEDYAYLIQALLQLGSATGEARYLNSANALLETTIAHFADPDSAYFFFTAEGQADVPLRKVELQDNATPSPNAVMAHNLLLLGLINGRQEWLDQGNRMLSGVAAAAEKYPYSFGYWCRLLALSTRGWHYVTVAGKKLTPAQLSEAPPHLFVLQAAATMGAAAPASGFLVCSATACLPPFGTWEDVIRFVNGT